MTRTRVNRGAQQPGYCLYRLCERLGYNVEKTTTRVCDLPLEIRRGLGSLNRTVFVFHHGRIECETNHIKLAPEGSEWTPGTFILELDEISGCSCGPNANFNVFRMLLADLMVNDRWEYLREYNLYADDDNRLCQQMDRYHEYLSNNYEGGVDRFFSPTGALKAFQAEMELTVAEVKQHVFARSIDEAVVHLEPVLAGVEGVFDLTAEPGTGKTSVLPFKFPSKKVVVVLPTPFDAWNAYNMATGACCLELKGLALGPREARVKYTDSYTGMGMLLAREAEMDVMIVDECDSDRGVTKFLAEVKRPGCVLIRMSASHGRSKGGASKAFTVTDCLDMPDVRAGVMPVAAFVSEKRFGRSMVLAPDATVAKELHGLIPGAVLVSAEAGLGNVARAVTNADRSVVFVTDDVCARGINLDLDCVFDTQLVSEYGYTRQLTAAEVYQRRYRVGRNRSGWYFAPGLPVLPRSVISDMDIVRHNVARAYAGVRQCGGPSRSVSREQSARLICSAVEPYVVVQREAAELAAGSGAVVEVDSGGSDESSVVESRSRSSSGGSGRRSSVTSPPAWLLQLSGCGKPVTSVLWDSPGSGTVAKSGGRMEYRVRRSSGDHRLVKSPRVSRRQELVAADGLSVGGMAAAVSRRLGGEAVRVSVPVAPPLMDLTELEIDLDWPSLLRERAEKGLSLPTLVPPIGWRHTSSGGMRTDWVRRMQDLAFGECHFDDGEFEVVARAWNTLVARDWVSYAPGARGRADPNDVEFCLRYFQSVHVLDSAC